MVEPEKEGEKVLPPIYSVDKELEDLDSPFKIGDPVKGSTELKAAFLGREEEMLVEYLRNCKSTSGYPLGYLICYFTHHYQFMSQRRLFNMLRSLVSHGIIEKIVVEDYSFYRLRKD